MKDIADQIRSIIDTSEPQLSQMNDNDTETKSEPGKWSKKEIVGHLIDSAANNHQRFVRAVYNVADQFPKYDQNEWVRIQQYNQMPWSSLLALFISYNDHLSRLIEIIPQDALTSPCNIGKDEPVTLEFVIKDYLRHLKHHLGKILD